MAPPGVKARHAMHRAKNSSDGSQGIQHEEREYSTETAQSATSCINRENYGEASLFQKLPVELQFEVVGFLDLKSLLALRASSRYWRDLINDNGHRDNLIHPIRRALLDLYDDVIQVPGFEESRKHILPHVNSFDREAFIKALWGHAVPEEFAFWIREWPSKAVIGWTWPGLEGQSTNSEKRWWRLEGQNMLAEEHVHQADEKEGERRKTKTCQLVADKSSELAGAVLDDAHFYAGGEDWNHCAVSDFNVSINADAIEIVRRTQTVMDFIFTYKSVLVLSGGGYLNGMVFTRCDEQMAYPSNRDPGMSWTQYLRWQMQEISKAWTRAYSSRAPQTQARAKQVQAQQVQAQQDAPFNSITQLRARVSDESEAGSDVDSASDTDFDIGMAWRPDRHGNVALQRCESGEREFMS